MFWEVFAVVAVGVLALAVAGIGYLVGSGISRALPGE